MPKRNKKVDPRLIFAGLTVVILAVIYLSNSNSVGNFIGLTPNTPTGASVDLKLSFVGGYPGIVYCGQQATVVAAVRITPSVTPVPPLGDEAGPYLVVKDLTADKIIAKKSISYNVVVEPADIYVLGDVAIFEIRYYPHYYGIYGNHEIEIAIDPDNEVVELNEINNKETLEIFSKC